MASRQAGDRREEITIGGRTYRVLDDGEIEGATGQCYGEEHFSHPYCFAPSEGFEEAEKGLLVTRHLNDNAWRYYVA